MNNGYSPKKSHVINKLLSVKPCMLFFVQTLPRILCAGVKNTESPRLSVLVPIELCVKKYGMHQCFLSRSRFTPLMSMERGLSVMGDCQCSYTGAISRVSRVDRLLGQAPLSSGTSMANCSLPEHRGLFRPDDRLKSLKNKNKNKKRPNNNNNNNNKLIEELVYKTNTVSTYFVFKFQMPSRGDTEKTVCCLCCASGPIKVSAQTDKGGYVPGETIWVTGSCDNNSRRNIHSVAAQLVQVDLR